MYHSHEDLELIKLSQSGNLKAFDQLVRVHEGWLRAWLRSRVHDWSAADDLAQDTFVTAFKKIQTFQASDPFEPWLRTIGFNHYRNYLRKHREEYVGGDAELQMLIATPEEDSLINGNASLHALEECMKGIDAQLMKLLDKHYTAGSSLREISKETKIGYSALTMKFHRTRQSLAQCIEGKLKTK